MAIKENESRLRSRYREMVIYGLASPYKLFDVLAVMHLAESAEQTDARALREDWEIVGECIQDAMDHHSRLIEPSTRRNHDK